jgi:hypothetical protein
MFLFISGLLSACASNNRSNYVTSIGSEDLTQREAVNVIFYQDRSLEARKQRCFLIKQLNPNIRFAMFSAHIGRIRYGLLSGVS